MKFDSLDNSIIICPREYFSLFLDYRRTNPLDNFKLYTLEEASELFAYQYDDRAIIYLLDKGLTYGASVDTLRSLKFVDDSNYKSKKLNNLVLVRDELLNKKLIWKTEYPLQSFINKKIKVFEYKNIGVLQGNLNKLPTCDIEYFSLDFEKKSNQLISFKDIYAETHYVINEICKLINKGVKPDDIYICGINDSYKNLIIDLFNTYKIPFDIKSDRTLLEIPVVREFLKGFENVGLEESLKNINDNYFEDPNTSTVISLGKTFFIEKLNSIDQINLYRDVFASYVEVHKKLLNAVHVLNNYAIPQGGHVFIINFCLGSAPSSIKDIDYLSDEDKNELGLLTTKDLNNQNFEDLKKLVQSSCIEKITSSVFVVGRGMTFDSPLVDMNVVTQSAKKPIITEEYSQQFSRYWTTYLLDEKYNLNKKSALTDYLSDKNELSHRMYEHFYDFKPSNVISKDQKINYSYSTVNNFYQCPFKYYCDEILDLGEFVPNFATNIGNIFHGVIENINKGENFEQSWFKMVEQEQENTVNGHFTNKEEFFLTLLKNDCELLIKFIQEFENDIPSKEIKSEVPLNFSLTDKIFVKGRIDKIMLTGVNCDAVSVIDYKKSNHGQLNVDLIPYGLCLQLPFYVYLLNKANNEQAIDMTDKEIIGLYIQQLIRKPSDGIAKPEEGVRKACKMDGIYSEDLSKITSMKTKGDSFTYIKKHQARKDKPPVTYITPELLKYFLESVEQKILEMDADLRNGNVDFRPKIAGQMDPCAYCSYRHVCYRRKNRTEVINPDKIEEEDCDA